MRILSVVGTRPEAIKLAPVIWELNQCSEIQHAVCVSGQHDDMARQALNAFDLVADFELRPASGHTRTLTETVASLAFRLERTLRGFAPDCVVVHGDTATSLAASLASYFNRIQIAHVEAGLRTGDNFSPWPEEGNRKMTGALADIHFAPTERARGALIKENVPKDRIIVTGNTVVDAVLMIKERIEKNPLMETLLDQKFKMLSPYEQIVTVTAHRRENIGDRLKQICEAVRELARTLSNTGFVIPVHPNPDVRSTVRGILSEIRNVILIKPADYTEFVYLLMRSKLILTDSGGIQEEAPSLGVPVLVMRDVTERPEATSVGAARLIGTNANAIRQNVTELLSDAEQHNRMANTKNPFGDGKAATRIRSHLIDRLRNQSRKTRSNPVEVVAATRTA
ncbi:MAG: UDP-N-acetylglucosamine 2-epimerase (non-hydrolyzing) [Paracoccaceae bacterium]|nr:UDP-N-acetylglucosamine 2-epimerase (non-hydrolyzing) [Paracoccaceae bacterium]